MGAGEVVDELMRQLVAARAREARDRTEIASLQKTCASLHQQVSAAREGVSDADTAAALAASDHEVNPTPSTVNREP